MMTAKRLADEDGRFAMATTSWGTSTRIKATTPPSSLRQTNARKSLILQGVWTSVHTWTYPTVVKVREVIATLEADGWHLVTHTWQSSAVSASGEERDGYGGGQDRHRRSGRNFEQHLETGWVEKGLARLMEYVVIIEQGDTSIGAYVPDLPGCVAVGESREEVRELIREAIELHIESLRENGETVPEPHSFVEKIAV